MKLLVVDDEKDIAFLFLQKFRNEIKNGSLEMLFAFSGEDALDILHSRTPQDFEYIFSDINMPGMSGIDFLHIVKSEYPEIKVSMISAYNDQVHIEWAKSEGALTLFGKPIDFEQIKGEVGKILNK